MSIGVKSGRVTKKGTASPIKKELFNSDNMEHIPGPAKKEVLEYENGHAFGKMDGGDKGSSVEADVDTGMDDEWV